MKKKIKKIISFLISAYKNVGLGRGAYIKFPYNRISGTISIGHETTIGKNAWLEAIKSYGSKYVYNSSIIIDDNVTIGNHVCVTSINKIKIGRGCLLSEYVYISDHYHDFQPGDILLVDQPLLSKGEVVIGDNCFIGYRASILSGVNLGNNCVVGSHSVVTKSFPAYSVVGGVPARLLKSYNFEKKKWE